MAPARRPDARDDAGDSDFDDEDDSAMTGSDDATTGVLLGYACGENETDDVVSQLGGEATYLSPPASPSLTACTACTTPMPLLLQLDADQPSRFPGHQRRLYLFACRRRACRRKPGSVRALRSVRVPAATADVQSSDVPATVNDAGTSVEPLDSPQTARLPERHAPPRLGAALFGGSDVSGIASAATATGAGPRNPFAASGPLSAAAAAAAGNPFTTRPVIDGSLHGESTIPRTTTSSQPPASRVDTSGDLSATFAQKARISTPAATTPSALSPDRTSHPTNAGDTRAPTRTRAYPRHFLDAEYEYLPPSPPPHSAAARANYAALMDVDGGASSGASAGGEYESAHDATFQRFADTLAHNAEQVLRYEFGGAPLLSSRVDAVGRLFAPAVTAAPTAGANVHVATAVGVGAGPRIPPCGRCGAARVFEAQLMPHAIAALEEDGDVGDDESTAAAAAAAAAAGPGKRAGGPLDDDGMAWSTVLIGVCARDCGPQGGGTLHVEEWAGVQWED